MRPGTTPHKVSPLKPFTGTTTLTSYNQNDVAAAGVSKDGAVCWLVREAVLEVMDTRTSQCLASWKFGEIICDSNAYITCVKEYQYGSNRRLLVGVCYSSSSGLLCILDLHLSKITKTIEIPQKISSIDPITNTGGDDVPVWALSAHMRHFYGIVAVGTNGGIVYLIDMCLDDDVETDEIKPNKLQLLSPRSRDTEQRRVQAMSRSQHLSMVLDEEAQGIGYKYRKCDGTVVKTFDRDAVHVSCLQYIQQIGSLFVGFSFGCYQIWRLHAPVLEYSSRLDGEMIPITHIAYQEPENDPKNFSYIWITRSTGDHQDDSLSIISLYQLAYNKKTMYSNYGAFYEDLTSVSLRFDLELVASPLNPSLKPTVSSRIISCYTLQDPCYKPPAKLDEEESFEETLHGPDLSLCVFVWECSDGSKQTSHMGIFDMNRWYHAQMPTTVRASTGPMDTCSYFSFLSLDEIAEHSEQGSVLAVYMSVDKLNRFTNTSLMPPEQHFYPAALAFNALCVVDEGIMKAQYIGTQRQVMATMQKMGPSVLLNPKELYNLCIVVGLLPRPLDTAASNPSPAQMKESLLTMALNYHMLSFIIKCVQEWALGEFVHVGCSLKFLLDWVWSRVAEIKNNIDNSCVTLYDWSGIPLDRRALQTLYQSNQRLGSILAIIKALIGQSAPTTEEGLGDLQDKMSVVTYIQQHLQMVIWFHKMGLLPERDEVEEADEKQYKYPAGMLIQSYSQKRQEIQKLDSSINPTDILMIDGMVEVMGQKVRDLWLSEGGNGLYPPCSLHALLSVYLLDDITLIDKHAVVLYALLDMVSLADPSMHDKLVVKVQKFSKKFGIPYTVVKQVQGFWLMDHKDFEESMSQILDPLVILDFGRWQHQRIVKSLLYQGESKMAARYLSTVQPSLSTPEEVKLKLTVLLANGMTAEALEYQRSCQDQMSAQDLLQHIFEACQQTRTVDQLLQLPLTGGEEETLVRFLTSSTDQYCQEVLILHYLQRSCYVEAIRLNEKLKQTVMTDASAKARERATARNAIVDGFMSVLSNVQKKMVWESYHSQKKPSVSRKEVKRPQPLSTKVTTRNYNMQSRSSLYAHVMSHVEEMEVEENLDTPEGSPELISRRAFLGTPVTPKLNDTLKTQPIIYPDINSSVWQNTSLGLNASSMTPIRSKLKVQGASALRLLQTPKVERKTPRKSTRLPSTAPTPQSILKVRNLIDSATKFDTPDTSSKDIPMNEPHSDVKLGFGEESMALSPTLIKQASPKISHMANANTGQGTPKKLRFAMEEDEDLEPVKTQREPLVLSAKKLRFSDRDAKASSAKTSGSLTSPKSALARTPIRPVKDRSPTPENISMSPKNRSKLDKVNRSPRASLSEEEENVKNKPQEDIEMEDNSFFSPSVPHPGEISAIKPLTNESEAASNPKEVSPTLVMTNFPKGRFTQLKNSPHKASPNKLSVSSLCRSPTVKLSQERTALFSDKEMVKASEEEVSTTTGVKEPIEIDLTMDEDTEEEEAPIQSGQGVDESIDQVRDRTLVSAADSSVDNIQTYAFAPPASTSDMPLMEKRSFQRIRSKHQFTFSPPVQVKSAGQREEGGSFDFSKTAEADSTSEMKTDNDEVFSSLNGKIDSSSDEGMKEKQSRWRRGQLRSQKFKFSPPSTKKTSGKVASVSSEGADGSFLDTTVKGRTKRTRSQQAKELAKCRRSQKTTKAASEVESSTEGSEDVQMESSDVPDSETYPGHENDNKLEQSKSRRGRSRRQNVAIDKESSDMESRTSILSPSRKKSEKELKSTRSFPSTRTSRKGSKSPSTSPSTKRTSRKGSKSPSASPSTKRTSRKGSESPSASPSTRRTSRKVSKSPSTSPSTRRTSRKVSKSPSASPSTKRTSRKGSKSPSASPSTKRTSRKGSKSPSASPSARRTSRKGSESPSASPSARRTSRKGSKSPSASPSTKRTSRKGSESPSASPSARRTSRKGSKSPSASPSARKTSRKGSKSPSLSPSQRSSTARSRSRSKSQEKVARKSTRKMAESISGEETSLEDKPSQHSFRRGSSRSKSPAKTEVLPTPTRHSARLRSKKSPSPLSTSTSKSTRGHKAGSSSRERSKSPTKPSPSHEISIRSHSKVEELEIEITPTPRTRGRRKKLNSESSEMEIPVQGTPSRRTRKKEKEEQQDETMQTEPNVPRTPSRRGKKDQMSESAVKTATPRRRGRKVQAEKVEQEKGSESEANVSEEDEEKKGDKDEGSEMETKEAVATPSRRGRKKQESTDHTIEESIVNPVSTPSRRSRRKAVEKDNIEQTATPSTPSRRGRRKPTKKEAQSEEELVEEDTGASKAEEDKGVEEPGGSMAEEEIESQPMEAEDRQGVKHDGDMDGNQTVEEENENNSAASLSFTFANPVDFDLDEDSKKELETSFEKANNFYFSPPLTRGLSKRLSIDPDGKTSISSRLSLEPDNFSRPSQRRLSQQGPELEPPIILPTDNVTPRPPIHENQPIPRRMSLRGSRSQTPEVQEKPKVPRRGASEPPDNPTVAKVRRRGRKKREPSPVDDVSLITPIPEDEPIQTRSLRSKRGTSEESTSSQSTSSQSTTRRGRRKAYKLW